MISTIQSICVSENLTLKEAMRVLDSTGFSILLVTENDSLKGTLSDGDVRRALLGGAHLDESISSLINTTPITVTSEWKREEVTKMLGDQMVKGKFTTGHVKIPSVDSEGKVCDLLFVSSDSIHTLSELTQKSKPPTISINHVLVIGGAGYIGSTLVRLLLQAGYKVTVLDSFMYGEDSLKEIDSDRLTLIKGDTQHIEDVVKAIHGVGAVIHLAELVGDPACALDPTTTQQINYLATRQIASICKHFQINRLIYMSSCSVYGASEKEDLLTEKSPLNPVSLYAKMKIECEKALLEMMDENFSPTILRLSTVFGVSHRPRFDLVVNLLTAKAIIDKKITIFGGDQWRPNVHVRDVARAIIHALEAPIEKVKGEVFNVGSESQNYTITAMGEMIHDTIPDSEIIFDQKEVDRRNYKVDFTKIRTALNFEAKTTVADGILEVKKLIESGAIKDYQDKKYSNVKFLNSKISDE